MEPALSHTLPDEVHKILDEFRQSLVNYDKKSKWHPPSDADQQDTTLAWREHVASLRFKTSDHVYCGKNNELSLVANTHAHVDAAMNEAFDHKVAEIFRRGQPALLINASDSGKTSLLLQGLRRHWGFYFNLYSGSGIGSKDLAWSIGKLTYEHEARKQFQNIILARFLLLCALVETIGTEESAQRVRTVWNSVQLSCRADYLCRADYPDRICDALEKATGVDQARGAEIIRDTFSRLQSLLGEDDFSLFYVVDDCQAWSGEYAYGIGLDAKEHREQIYKVWGDLLAALPWLTPVFAATGARAPDYLKRCFPSLQTVVSSTGASNPEHVRDFLRSYLPASLVASEDGKLLLERAGLWLRGRHKMVAEFVKFFLDGTPISVLDGPHTMLHRFITEKTDFIARDDIRLAVDKGTDPGLYRLNPYVHRYHASVIRENLKARTIMHHILYQYLVLGHAPCTTALSAADDWIVSYDLGYYADDNMSKIVIDEPLTLVRTAQLFWSKNRDELPFLSHKLIYSPDVPSFASPREHAVLLFSRFFATPHAPSEAFVFPGKKAPEWAKRRADLVELRPGFFEDGNPKYRVCRHADYPASAVLPLATDGSSYATTLSWLRHEHDTAFCMLPDPTAFMFALRRAEGGYLWVIVRVVPHADFSPHKGGLGAYFQGKDQTADVSEALELLRTSLPNPCDALGDLPVLEVAMQAPDLNAPDRQTRTREARDALVHWKLNHIPLPSPYPNKYKIVTVKPYLVQYTETMLEQAAEADRPWILSRMVANIVGETSISPDRHGRRRKTNASLPADSDTPVAASSSHSTSAQTEEGLASDKPPSTSSQYVSQSKSPTGETSTVAGKRKRSESPTANSNSDLALLDEVEPPSSKRSKIDSKLSMP
ncbi:hypothetical protein EV714DRAFT_285986 [Schizophyllum commune]